MANPIHTYIIPNCGVDIELVAGDLEDASFRKVRIVDQKSRSKNDNMMYSMTSKGIPLMNSSGLKKFTGSCSPLHPVTLPRVVKRNTGILPNAAYYCYVHPPLELAEIIDWKAAQLGKRYLDEKEDLTKVNYWAAPYFAVLGGFVYFDQNRNIIAVNALSMLETAYDLKLSGPFLPTDIARDGIRRSRRALPFGLEYFNEIGLAAFAWIHPMERIYHSEVTEQFSNKHGSFMFFNEDGSAVVYCVDPGGFINPEGETSSLVDAYQACKKSTENLNNHNVPPYSKFKTMEEIQQTRLAISNIVDPRSRHDFLHFSGEARTLLHEAFKAGCDAKTILRHLDTSELSNLSYRDKYGYTPLHYACKQHPQDTELINHLIEKCPELVLIMDRFDRYPLHVACDNRASADLVAKLIGADPGKKSIQQRTKFLGRKPIHIALYGKLSKVAISHLLKADPSCVALTTKSSAGRLPLHIAIEQHLETDIIKMLLDTNSRDNHEHKQYSVDAIEMSVSLVQSRNGSSAIYHYFEGMIPLHVACWNKSPPETIKALLDADIENTTVDAEVGSESFLRQKVEILDGEAWVQNFKRKHAAKKRKGLRATIIGPRKIQEAMIIEKDMELHHRKDGKKFHDEHTIPLSNRRDCILPLHIACKNGSYEVISLLLEKEKEKFRDTERLDNIKYQDHRGRIPLHIACRHTTDSRIIESLLEMDEGGETPRVDDDWCFKPIHYACDKKDACEEIVQLLVVAEEKDQSATKRCTHTLEKRKRSPLYLAVKAGANEKVVEILLGPEQFFLKGFDGDLVSNLSSMAVKNRKIQDCIIEKLTERCYFNLLFIDVYSNACALFFFILGSERMMNGEGTFLEPLMIRICYVIFLFRHVIHIKSRTFQFFAGFWNWASLTAIVLLALSARHMEGEIGNDEPVLKKELLIVTGALMVIQMTFFLRATFLPFARFVGGLITIFSTLVPFFIVASLMLLAFAYGFMIQENGLCEKNLWNCYAFTLQGFFSGFDDTNDILDVLFGFIAIIVLLNVVIAIVSDAWQSADERAISLFWKFRLEFLCEARFFAYLDKRMCRGGKIDQLGTFVDKMRAIKFADDTPWSSYPYTLVTSKQQYDQPLDYFHPTIANEILKAKSLQADLYWAQSDSREKEKSRAQKKSLYFVVIFKWILMLMGNFVLCAAGLVTAGWVWPQSIRRRVLAIGLNEVKRTSRSA